MKKQNLSTKNAKKTEGHERRIETQIAPVVFVGAIMTGRPRGYPGRPPKGTVPRITGRESRGRRFGTVPDQQIHPTAKAQRAQRKEERDMDHELHEENPRTRRKNKISDYSGRFCRGDHDGSPKRISRKTTKGDCTKNYGPRIART
jgi:hypothetical protein